LEILNVICSTDEVSMATGEVMDNDDADWYRQEVGEEPEPGRSR